MWCMMQTPNPCGANCPFPKHNAAHWEVHSYSCCTRRHWKIFLPCTAKLSVAFVSEERGRSDESLDLWRSFSCSITATRCGTVSFAASSRRVCACHVKKLCAAEEEIAATLLLCFQWRLCSHVGGRTSCFTFSVASLLWFAQSDVPRPKFFFSSFLPVPLFLYLWPSLHLIQTCD